MISQFRQNLILQQTPRSRNYSHSPSVSEEVRQWLTLPGSLTRHLRRHFQDFSVEVLHESWQKPLRTEANMLNIPHDRHAWVREVHLIGDGAPRLYARTVVPEKTLRHHGHRLRRLRTQPLGEFLFCHPHLQRGSFHRLQLPASHRAYTRAMQHRLSNHQTASLPEKLYGRGSIFYLLHGPLLVSEYFLTEMPKVHKRFYCHAC